MEPVKKRRGGQFPAKRSLVLRAVTDEAIAKASDRYATAVGTLLREAVEDGISTTLERYRKRHGKGGGKDTGKSGGK